MNQKILFKFYQSCADPNQQIMQVMAVIYGSCNRQQLIDCLNHLGIKTKNNQVFDAVRLRPHVSELMDQGLIITNKSRAILCNPLVAELITCELIETGKFAAIATAVNKVFPNKRWGKNNRFSFTSSEEFFRAARIALYENDFPLLTEYIDAFNHPVKKNHWETEKSSIAKIAESIFQNLPDQTLFQKLLPDVYEVLVASTFAIEEDFIQIPEASFLAFEKYCRKAQNNLLSETKVILIRQYLLRGSMDDAAAMIQSIDDPTQSITVQALQGWLYFVTGQCEQSIEIYTEALQLLKTISKKRKNIYFKKIEGIFFILALLQKSSPESLAIAAEICAFMQAENHWLQSIYWGLWHLTRMQQGELTSKTALGTIILTSPLAVLENIFLSFFILNGDRQKLKNKLIQISNVLRKIYLPIEKNGYHWLAFITADLQAIIYQDLDKNIAAEYQQQATKLRGANWQSLTTLLDSKESWELSLQALANLPNLTTKAATEDSDKRLIWLLSSFSSYFDLEPREQKRKANGDWSKGRAIAKRRIDEELSSFTYFTDQDRKICSYLTVERNYSYYGSEVTYGWRPEALIALVDHPLVFLQDRPNIRLEIKKGDIQLRVQEISNRQLSLSLDPLLPNLPAETSFLVKPETPTRLRIYSVTAEHKKIASIIGEKNCLTVPIQAKEQVLAAINGVANLLTIHSDIGGGDINAREITADPTPHVHLFPSGAGLKVSILVCPFGEEGPYYHPAKGGELVVAEVAGERLKTKRNFEEEAGYAFDVLQACPLLLDCPREDGEFFVDDPEQCLELLASLHNMGDRLVVEWPQGEKFRITHYGSASNFHGNIRQERDWFALEGELRLSDDLVLDMQNLLQLLEKTPGRFIQLDEGKFIALTHEFRRRLDDLRAFSDQQGKNTKIHPLAAFALGDFTDEMQLNADKHWQQHIKKIRSLGDIQAQIPSTLQAELRDYQVDGFKWLMRLAHWQMGACLADDMGLGKTLQALTAILARATQGASLVIAPTSVCMNWIAEAGKFAPTLNVIAFGSGAPQGGSRQETLDQLQPFDLVVCSYGLLQQEDVGKMLAQVKWTTIVLDEAQAIKNSATKRSQAAMNLQGDFKMITTGTPIENHLGELWNLFRFINPGLLGSQKSFNERFANAIERNQDKETKLRLKRLIQPFILRRTKTQVLTELPSRTEITLTVELTQAEMAMYEALRREAIAKLTESTAEYGAKHLQVLAEIMKLRRMCCNPRLVIPDTPLTGSKLQLFGEVLEELLENNHKALVFSQFVDHLTILRSYLDEKNISYQYLDGSTSTSKRKQAVNNFQAGEGDVFLISLKAGGTGLNLTAADYVIHMDPWWNPAVEDQASDRAHRMGQQRPVTIYRLVAQNTIEEKIVALHQHKRDLANSLLEGTDSGGKMSTDDLINLIREA